MYWIGVVVTVALAMILVCECATNHARPVNYLSQTCQRERYRTDGVDLPQMGRMIMAWNEPASMNVR